MHIASDVLSQILESPKFGKDKPHELHAVELNMLWSIMIGMHSSFGGYSAAPARL